MWPCFLASGRDRTLSTCNVTEMTRSTKCSAIMVRAAPKPSTDLIQLGERSSGNFTSEGIK